MCGVRRRSEERATGGRGPLGRPAVRGEAVRVGEVLGIVLVKVGAPDDVGAFRYAVGSEVDVPGGGSRYHPRRPVLADNLLQHLAGVRKVLHVVVVERAVRTDGGELVAQTPFALWAAGDLVQCPGQSGAGGLDRTGRQGDGFVLQLPAGERGLSGQKGGEQAVSFPRTCGVGGASCRLGGTVGCGMDGTCVRPAAVLDRLSRCPPRKVEAAVACAERQGHRYSWARRRRASGSWQGREQCRGADSGRVLPEMR